MKIKRAFALILALLLLNIPVNAENITNPMENDLFNVVAKVGGVQSLSIFKNGISRCHYSDNKKTAFVDYTGSIVPNAKESNESSIYLTLDGNFNDGVKIGQDTNDKWSYMDINNNVLGNVPLYGYADYNVGYFSSIDNFMTNSGMLNTTVITSYKKDFEYTFKDTYIPAFDDNGYSVMNLNDENGAPIGSYIIRLKQSLFPTVQLNGKKLAFDQIPVIENGRTLVPVRGIFEALSATVDYNSATKTITAIKGSTTITFTINSNIAQKNGETISLEVPAKIINNRTLVPVRFIADCFGVNVSWDGTYKIVDLTTK